MIHAFERPAYLLLALAVIPAFALYVARVRAFRDRLIPFVVRAEGFSPEAITSAIRRRAVFFSLAWVMLACAAAGPRWGSELETTQQEGEAVMFVMDVSRSMSVADVPPSRLAFASSYASMLVARMPDARIGVVLAKGKSVLAIPLTSDSRVVTDLFAALTPAVLSAPGTDIAAGVLAALEAFPPSGASARTIVLMTDGDETSGSLDDAARAVGESGARLLIIGIGTASGAEINSRPRAQTPQPVVTALRDEPLRRAVRVAGRGSAYVTGLDSGSARVILSAIGPSAGKDRRVSYSPKPVYRYAAFLTAALLFFCAGLVQGGPSWRRK